MNPQTAFFEDYKPADADFLSDTLKGLAASPKKLLPQYLYDAAGAKLFEEICQTTDYYVTRTELALLDSIQGELATLAKEKARLVEFGMGEGTKARLLLNALKNPFGFVGIDISLEQLQENIHAMTSDYPTLNIGGVCANFFDINPLPAAPAGVHNIGFFPGSTIGNYQPDEQKQLLQGIARALGSGSSLIMGVDLKKNASMLRAAYDDSDGATARFSLNLLTRMQRELGAKLDPKGFKHEATYNEAEGCIKICLRALHAQTIEIGAHSFSIAVGEPIYTENAYKWTVAQFQDFASKAGWLPETYWCDDKGLFSIHWLRLP